MRCSKCNGDNREGRKFCANCGAPLAVTCPTCGATNQPGERFCGECGAGLVEPPAAKGRGLHPIATSISGERRHLTVLFCDLVGSSQIAAQLDPEEWRDLVAGYHRASAEVITRYGGHVAKYFGRRCDSVFRLARSARETTQSAARAQAWRYSMLSQSLATKAARAVAGLRDFDDGKSAYWLIERSSEDRAFKFVRAMKVDAHGRIQTRYICDDLLVAARWRAQDLIAQNYQLIRLCPRLRCQKFFLIRHGRQQYCSPNCEQVERNARWRREHPEKAREQRRVAYDREIAAKEAVASR